MSASVGRAQQKQSMHELKLRRLLDHNQRLREELSRPRVMVSIASMNLVNYCRATKDPLIPAIWGPLPKGEDPYAPVEQGGCCSPHRVGLEAIPAAIAEMTASFASTLNLLSDSICDTSTFVLEYYHSLYINPLMPQPDHLLDYAEEDLFGEDDVENAQHVNTAVPLSAQPPSRLLRSPSPPATAAQETASSEARPSRMQYPISAMERQRVADIAQTRIDELREKKRSGSIHEGNGRGATSLRKACLKVAIHHSDRIWDVGAMTYSQIRPLLDRMPADQLEEVERNSKHLKKDTDWLWELFLLDEYPLFHERCREREGKPRDRGWRRMYRQAKEDADQRQAQAIRRVKERYDQIDKQRASKRIVLMDELVADKKRRHTSSTHHRSASGTSAPRLSGLNTAQHAMAKARAEVQRERIAITHAAGRYKPPVNRARPQGPTELFKNPYIAQEKASEVPPKSTWASNGLERLPRPRGNGGRKEEGDLRGESEHGASSPIQPIPGSYPTAQRDEYRSKLPAHLAPSTTDSVARPEERFRISNESKSKYQTIRKRQVQNFEPPKQKSVVVDFFGDDEGQAPKGLVESLMRSEGAAGAIGREQGRGKSSVASPGSMGASRSKSETDAAYRQTNGSTTVEVPKAGVKRALPPTTPPDPASVLFRKKKKPMPGKK